MSMLTLCIEHQDKFDSNDFNIVWKSSDILKIIRGIGDKVYVVSHNLTTVQHDDSISDSDIKDFKRKVRDIACDANKKVLLRYQILINNPYLPRRDVYVWRGLYIFNHYIYRRVLAFVEDDNDDRSFAVNCLLCPITCALLLVFTGIRDFYDQVVIILGTFFGLIADLFTGRDMVIGSGRLISLPETEWLNINLLNDDYKYLDSKMIEDKIAAELEKLAEDMRATEVEVKRESLPVEVDEDGGNPEFNIIKTSLVLLNIPAAAVAAAAAKEVGEKV